jgi:GH15 family glucan-1,4-alpha-glucosidase
VATLWLTQYKIVSANSMAELAGVIADLEWVAKFSKSGMLSEQLNPYNGEEISATPLTWSHSEFVRTIIEYDRKMKSFSSVGSQ